MSRCEVQSFNQAGPATTRASRSRIGRQQLSDLIKHQSSEQNDSAWKRARNDRGSGEQSNSSLSKFEITRAFPDQSRLLTVQPDASVTRSDGNLNDLQDSEGPFLLRPDGLERHESVVTPAFAMNPKFKDIFASERPASESSPNGD